MKFSKKSTMLIVFLLGAVIFASSAFADTVLGSGYNSLKNSLKTTTNKLTNEVDNFSVDIIISMKVDENAFSENSYSEKYDIKNQAQESNTTTFQKGSEKENYQNYYYTDLNQTIYKNFEDGSYNVIERQNPRKDDRKILEDPFEEEQAKDAEKIVDAFVGSLEDVIQVEESGNKKMYIGNIADEEIPALVNALSSFVLKYSIVDEYTSERYSIPYPKSNIYLIDASGKAIGNEDGIIESGIFTASMSAEDENGAEHIYTLEISIDIKDINKTVVAAPNLEGQEVTYSKEGYEFDEKFIGKYKNNIVAIEGNSFVKYGERFIEITSVENGNIKGRYYELYEEGHEPDTVRDFEFTSNQDDSEFYTILNYTDNNGEMKQGVLHRSNMQDISVSFEVEVDEDGNGYTSSPDEDFTNEFMRVFE